MTVTSTEGQWSARPWLSGVLRVAIVGVPVLVGAVAARLLASQVADWHNRWGAAAVVAAVAVGVSISVSRLTNRLLPLALLLRMTMLFPDRAPTRLKVARQTTSVSELKAKLHSQRLDESEAAATMLALVTALGRHDRQTRGHSERVRLFCDLLASELNLSRADAGRLRWAALIHDIGKLETPATVLNKPGKLDAREWVLIKQHPDAGARLAAPLQGWLGPWFSGIAEHHERYDGLGYPRGLGAGNISPSGRAIAVVDAFETMTAARSYKAAVTTIAARAELTRCAGSHFDPVMVRAFLRIALPRLVWTVGPLAFVVNAPYLAWLGQTGRGLGQVVTASTATAANAAGVAAVAVAVSTASPATSADGLKPELLQKHHYQATHGQRATEPKHKDKRHSQAAGPAAPQKVAPAKKPAEPHPAHGAAAGPGLTAAAPPVAASTPPPHDTDPGGPRDESSDPTTGAATGSGGNGSDPTHRHHRHRRHHRHHGGGTDGHAESPK
jgi:putative nucleotidyltransferase with HDIG domain